MRSVCFSGRIQRALGVSEALIPVDIREWHHYSLSWSELDTQFWVDDQLVLEAPYGPRGPLGFVAWIDNQYAVATPRGRFGWGLLTGAVAAGCCSDAAR